MSVPTRDNEEIGNRWPEVGVACFLLLLAVLVIVDSMRVGTGWADDGPQSGYFPFYIGLLLFAASGWILFSQLRRWSREDGVFAERAQLSQVIAMLVPMIVYVALVYPLGIYVPSAVLIAYFMRRYGKYGWPVTAVVSVGVPVAFLLVFERWFLVPLPKGPLERMLGM
jgi:putative tricarboxylic transport membrane protein